MPAIQPALLRRQSALLAEQFDQSEAYTRSLHHLLDFYADRSLRPGQPDDSPLLLYAYNVPLPVLRQIKLELVPHIIENPVVMISLADTLWKESYYEFRYLAVSIIGEVVPVPAERIIRRIEEWLIQHPEEALVKHILITGSERLRSEATEQYLKMVSSWIASDDPYFKQPGLHALILLIKNPKFENFPIIFQKIQPFVLSASSILRPDVLGVVRALALRSPHETAYFLQQQLSNPTQVDVPYIIRQSRDSFPEEIRARLLSQIRSR